MGTAKKYLVWLIAFGVAFFVMKSGKQALYDQQAQNRVEEKVAKLQEAAKVKAAADPSTTLSQALIDYATEDGRNELAKHASNSHAQKLIAADRFFGFHYVNVVVRPAYCQKLGVGIRPFVDAFEQVNAIPLVRMRAIHADQNLSNEKLKRQLDPLAVRLIDDDMAEAATREKITPKVLCEAFANFGDLIAQEMVFAKSQPEMYAALMK